MSADSLVDGNEHFVKSFCPHWFREGMNLADIGGGKRPFVDSEAKARLRATVTGIDISQQELAQAPAGAYDQVICADIASIEGDQSADVCVCCAVLEHVKNVEGAFKSMSTILKPGGVALIFVPSRHAVFAKLNLLLPEAFKKQILYAIYPQSRKGQGFKSYYNSCSPSEFRELANRFDLEVVDFRAYYKSSYFQFFLPLYVLWRIWMVGFRAACGTQAAETFSYAFQKREAKAASTAPRKELQTSDLEQT